MSCFDKLQILGIRSFGPKDGDAGFIKFSSPLTLILGDNGCGKTTIIEAIKFATSGELPGGTRSGGNCNFVHDPKLTDAMEVKGQIKLQVKDVNGKTLSVSRIVSATQKLKKLEFKSVDQLINRKLDDGTWSHISGKCADIDNEMCYSLGVSKAVLSNVLLCHQEDSNWPLEEDSKVKLRFDEIFGATKYNKCLDQIRLVRKKILEDGKLLEGDIKFLVKYKDEAAQKRIQLSDAELRLFEYKQQLAVFYSKLEPIQETLKDLAQKEDKIVSLKTEQETQKTKLEGVRSTIAEYKTLIQYEFKGTIEKLQEAIKNFGVEIIEKQKKFDELEKQGEDVTVELKRNQQLMSSEQFKIGQLLRDLEKNKERLKSRNEAMLALSDDVGISTSVTQLSQSDEIQRVLYSIEQSISQLEDEVVVVKEEQKAKVTTLQGQIDNFREEKAKLEQNVSNQRKQMEHNKKELKKVKDDIFEVDQSADKLGMLQTKLDAVKREIEDIAKNNNLQDIENEIKDAERKKEKHEDSLSDLEREIQTLQSLSSIQAELDIQKAARDGKETEIKKLKNRHQDTLEHLLKEVPEQGIKLQLEVCMDKLADEIKSKSEELNGKEKELAMKEAEQKHLSEKLKVAKQTLESDEFAINQACCGNDYDTYLTELSNKIQELQDQKGTLTSSQFMFRKYVQKLQERDPCCPLCKRDFNEEDNVTLLVSELSSKVQEVPTKLRVNKDKLDNLQEKYKTLLQLKPKHEKLSILKSTEIPGLESDFRKAERKLIAVKEGIVTLKNELEKPQADEALAKGLQSDIVLLEQHLTESRRLGREIQQLESKLPAGNRRSLHEALQEQRELRTLFQKARRSLETLQNKRNNINVKKNKLQEEKNSIQDQQLKISGNVQMRAQLAEKRDELESLDVMFQLEIDKGIEQLSMDSRKLDQLSRQMKTLVTNNSEALDLKTSKLKDIDQRFTELKNQHRAIVEFDMSGGAKKLESSQQSLSSLQKENDSLQQKKDGIYDERDQIKNDISSQTVRQRELDDNLKLRLKLEEEKDLIEKYNKLKIQMGNLDFTSLYNEKKKYKMEEEKLFNDKAQAEGSRRELEKNIESINKELDKDHYKNADKNYQDKLIEVEVLKRTMNDLNVYYKVLDFAMINYHKKRIEHINSVIRELWRKIYSGNDIDTIEIKADQEETASADKRRAYKYRVVQLKSGTELEMRGRCSAGQRVLACLIIRIALAETFSSTCGILALDEPTTNLDHQNIINLSSALEEIVKRQSVRKNFQLIIITHDQEFLNILTRVGQIDHYYRLERNFDGISQVIKVNIN